MIEKQEDLGASPAVAGDRAGAPSGSSPVPGLEQSRSSHGAELYEALELADLLLSGANMNPRVVERKVRAALAKARGNAA